MIGKGAQYLTAAGYGRYRITAASLGSLDLLGTLGWLTAATRQAIMAAFGATDGTAVIRATNEYLNGIAASDRAKATALAGFINEDPMMVCSLGLEPQGVTMPVRYWYYKDGQTVNPNHEIYSFGFYDTMTIKFGYKKNTAIQWQELFTMGTPIQYVNMISCGSSNGSVVYRIGNGSTYTDYRPYNFVDGTLYVMDVNQNRFRVNNGSWYQHSVRTPFDTTTFPNMTRIVGNMAKTFYYAEHKDNNGVVLHHYVPQGDNCLVDLIGAEKFESANGNKPFEFKYTRNGQPWTPPTP